LDFSSGSVVPGVWFLGLFVLDMSVLSAFIKHKLRIFMHTFNIQIFMIAFFAIYLLFDVFC
jgi:hypothetical protein